MQKDKLLQFFDESKGACFRLKIKDVQVGYNTEPDISKEEVRGQLETLIDYANEGEKLELSVSVAKNFQNAANLVLWNTESGRPERGFGSSTSTTRMNESSYQQGYDRGFDLGVRMGKMEADREYMLKAIAESNDSGKGGLLENLSSSETGQAILAALLQKTGLM